MVRVGRASGEYRIQPLTADRSFNCVTDLAQYLPVTIVADRVGLRAAGREIMLEWSASIFQLVGPLNELSEAALSSCVEMFDFTQSAIATDDSAVGRRAFLSFANRQSSPRPKP
jgi:hypothetical protein